MYNLQLINIGIEGACTGDSKRLCFFGDVLSFLNKVVEKVGICGPVAQIASFI